MISSWSEYQKETLKTAVYPNVGNNLGYAALGLIDEYGEFLEKWYIHFNTDQDLSEELEKELGDLYWYFSSVCREVGYNLADIVEKSSVEEINDTMDVFKVAGIAKKWQRDGKEIIEEKDLFGKLVSLWSYVHYALYPTDREGQLRIAQMNLEKLFDRKERGVLKGNGDNR